MPLAGLIGYPLAHSFSPAYFARRFDELGMHNWQYRAFPLKSIVDLPLLIRDHPDLLALNVTIPHKQDVLAYCKTLDENVMAIGAANLICIKRNGASVQLSAHNTDVYGFKTSLLGWYVPDGKKALVLGSGGSSKAVAKVLNDMKIPFDTAGRQQTLHYSQVRLSQYGLVVNCTPAGMFNASTTDIPTSLDLPFTEANSGHQFFDLVYNPAETVMMKRFSDAGARVKNGLEMLHLQAEMSLEIMRGN